MSSSAACPAITIWSYHYSSGQVQSCHGPGLDSSPGDWNACPMWITKRFSHLLFSLQQIHKYKQTKTKVKQPFQWWQQQQTFCPSAGKLTCLKNDRQSRKSWKELLLNRTSISARAACRKLSACKKITACSVSSSHSTGIWYRACPTFTSKTLTLNHTRICPQGIKDTPSQYPPRESKAETCFTWPLFSLWLHRQL